VFYLYLELRIALGSVLHTITR